MNKLKKKWQLGLIALLPLVLIACSISFNNNEEEKSSPEQTLQAIYLERTQTAQASFVEPEHQTVPGNPGPPQQTKKEIDTSKTASDKHALGDSFRLGNLERPFTETNMDYHPETDLIEISLSEGSGFYYFTIEVFSGSEESGFPSASYGIEFDTDLDGRGDILLWAEGIDSSDWTVENLSVLRDSNNDVGGSAPVVPDGNGGDGYDEVLFSNDKMDDPDAAWQRKKASDIIYLAVKTTLVGNSPFMWKVWADSGTADPAQFDYNDAYSESQAGSPIKNSDFYPVSQLNRVDSTCWINFGYQLSGNLLGGCEGDKPAQPPPSPEDPPPAYVPRPTTGPPPPPCRCPADCGSIKDYACCKHCGCLWNGDTGGGWPCENN